LTAQQTFYIIAQGLVEQCSLGFVIRKSTLKKKNFTGARIFRVPLKKGFDLGTHLEIRFRVEN